MTAWSIPQIFFQGWSWLAIMAGLCVALHYALIGRVLLYSAILFDAIHQFHSARAVAPESAEIQTSMGLSSFVIMVVWSGLTGAAIGFLSFFQSGLTRLKRIVLLNLCLLLVFLATMVFLAGPGGDWRSIVQLGAMSSVANWVVNGPGVLTGQPLPEVLWRIMCRLRLASGDLPGRLGGILCPSMRQ
jgi:hypothetical protein